jgi:hypothetical protein
METTADESMKRVMGYLFGGLIATCVGIIYLANMISM